MRVCRSLPARSFRGSVKRAISELHSDQRGFYEMERCHHATLATSDLLDSLEWRDEYCDYVPPCRP